MGFLDIFKASENKQLRESLAMQTQLLNQRTKELMQKTEALEQLHQQRVNKVNLRKEFFRVSLDELEQIVLQHDPSAEFKRTMAAEQYYQSLNRDEVVAELDYDITDDE